MDHFRLPERVHYFRIYEDLIDLNLAYAPPFATAIDVLIHAATTLENIRLRGS